MNTDAFDELFDDKEFQEFISNDEEWCYFVAEQRYNDTLPSEEQEQAMRDRLAREYSIERAYKAYQALLKKQMSII